MSHEAVILAGGLGTRLRSVVSDLPKPMAPVHGRPFLDYLVERLVAADVDHVVFAVGYMWEAIRDHFGTQRGAVRFSYSVEEEQLGTGGGIRQALGYAKCDRVLALNGDTFLEIDYRSLYDFHLTHNSKMTVSTIRISDPERYDPIHFDPDFRIRGFGHTDPAPSGSAYINSGVYLLDRDLFAAFPMPPIFSFERDFLQARVDEVQPFAFTDTGAFLDIGVPEDYRKAEELL